MTILNAFANVTLPQGKRPLEPNNVIGLAVHHTAGGNAPMHSEAAERAVIRAIDNLHLDKGFGLFGYHMIAFNSRRVYQTGSLFGSRAHVEDRNHQLVGIVMHGNFTTTLPNDPLIAALREGLNYMLAYYPDRPIKGHRDWAFNYSSTACPGDAITGWDWNRLLKEDDEVYNIWSKEARWGDDEQGWRGRKFGAESYNINLMHDLSLNPHAGRVRLEVYLKAGEIKFYHKHGDYAGQVGWNNSMYSVIEIEPGTNNRMEVVADAEIAHIGSLGYYT